MHEPVAPVIKIGVTPKTFTVDPSEFKPCGDCSMCCKVPPIEGSIDLDKPAGKWCKHFKKGVGCGVYETREHVCRSFQCLWKITEELGEELKPSRSKCVLAMYKEQVLIAYVDPAYPQAWKKGAMGRFLRGWPEKYIVECGDTKFYVHPEEQ